MASKMGDEGTRGAPHAPGQSTTCAKCAAILTPDSHVHLWDGKDYCEGCLEAACPGMADYARQHPRLTEQLEPGPPPGPGRLAFDILVLVLSLPILLIGFSVLVGAAVFLHPLLVVLAALPTPSLATSIWLKMRRRKRSSRLIGG